MIKVRREGLAARMPLSPGKTALDVPGYFCYVPTGIFRKTRQKRAKTMKRATDEASRQHRAAEQSGGGSVPGNGVKDNRVKWPDGRRFFLAAALAMLVTAPTLSGCAALKDWIYCEKLGEPKEDKPGTTMEWMRESKQVRI